MAATWRLTGVAALGILSLVGFAVTLTRVDAAFAGRAYAAHGGIYIAASLVWLWRVEDQQPTGSDVLGASIAIVGALLIVGFAARTRSPLTISARSCVHKAQLVPSTRSLSTDVAGCKLLP